MCSSTRSTRALLAAFAALSGFVCFSSAQSVATAPVGAVTTTLPVGISAVGLSLLNPDLAVANCSANSPTVLTLAGVSNVGALLTTGLPFYVECISGALEGERFDVDTAQTITDANGTVTLVASSANNTAVLTASEAVGSQFALRKHITLQQVQSMFSSPLVAANSVNNADQIRLFNADGGVFITYFLRTQTTWLTGSTASNNVVIPPGTGFLFRKIGAPGTLTSTGAVRLNDFSMPMAAGLSFRSSPYPLSISPLSLGATIANGWTGANSANSADQIRTYDFASGVFITSFMRANGVWLQGSTTVTSTNLVSFDGGYLLSRRNADTDYILASPL